MPKKDKTDNGQVFIREPQFTNVLEIHINGDLLPNSSFLKILGIMKTHMKCKTIVFAVYDFKMLRLVRESIPSEYYDRIELYGSKAFEEKEGLRRAG